MENTTTKSSSGGWKVMGILSVVLGGLSILFSFIPCLGAYAMYSGILAAILSAIALVMANSAKASKTMAIIGLVISLASAGLGYWRYTQLQEIGTSLQKFGNDLKDSLNKK